MNSLYSLPEPHSCHVAGSGSTLLSKSLYGVRAPRRADGRPKLFRKPLANTTLMFLGMALLLPLAPLLEWIQTMLKQLRGRQRRRHGASTVPASDATQRGSIDEPLLPPAAPPAPQRPLAAAEWLRQCGLLIVPTLLDVACTATHKIGGCWDGGCQEHLMAPPVPACAPCCCYSPRPGRGFYTQPLTASALQDSCGWLSRCIKCYGDLK